jgi:hypothetical protein
MPWIEAKKVNLDGCKRTLKLVNTITCDHVFLEEVNIMKVFTVRANISSTHTRPYFSSNVELCQHAHLVDPKSIRDTVYVEFNQVLI